MKLLISNNRVVGAYEAVIETTIEYQCDGVILPKSVVGTVTVVDSEASVGDIWDGVAFSKPVVIPVIEIPQSVTMVQARKALYRFGLYATVNNAIMTGIDEELKIDWEFELSINRNNAGLIAMAMALNLTTTQLDDLFVLAATL